MHALQEQVANSKPAPLILARQLQLPHRPVHVLKQLTENMLSEEFAAEVHFILATAAEDQPAVKPALMDARLIPEHTILANQCQRLHLNLLLLQPTTAIPVL